MKYLKKYSIFESNDDIKQDCLDILREIEDDGYEVKAQVYANSITFYIYKLGVLDFNVFWREMKDVIERLQSYLSDCEFIMCWDSPKERIDKIPKIQISKIMNPMTFEYVGEKTWCQVSFIK
jgi:hypothetical protein